MKRVVLFLSLLCVGTAFAAGDKISTSKSYVDTQIATKQEKIPAVNTNTVLTHTNTDGEIGEKAIYDATANYATQTDALVTAADANAAIQNAIDTEFVCTEWAENAEPTNDNCYIWEVVNAKHPTLPNGYTQLEYLSSDKSECIITNVAWGNVYEFRGRAQQTVVDSWNEAIFGSSSSEYNGMYGTYYGSATQTKYWYWINSISYLDIAEFKFNRANGNYWHGTVNGVSSPQGSIVVGNTDYVRLLCTGTTYRWFTGNIWYLQLIDQNGNFLLNAIPVKRDSDGLVGLYDFVSGQMLTNSGNGTFVAGPVKSYIPQGQ